MSDQLGRGDPRVDTAAESPGRVVAGEGEQREEPIGDLLKRLSQETTNLVKLEIDLAKAELTTKAKAGGIGAGMLAAAGVVALLMLGALTAFLILLLDGVLANWLAALVVTIFWAAVAAGLALTGKKKLQEAVPPAPEQTIETLKEDAAWAKTQKPSART